MISEDSDDYLGPIGITYHQNGDVTVWNVFVQGWERMPAGEVSDELLSTLSHDERQKIGEMAVAK